MSEPACLAAVALGAHRFLCGGDRGHPGFHFTSFVDDNGNRVALIWNEESRMSSPRPVGSAKILRIAPHA